MAIRTFPLLTKSERDLDALVDEIYALIPRSGTSDWWAFVRWHRRGLGGTRYGTKMPRREIRAVVMAMKKIEAIP